MKKNIILFVFIALLISSCSQKSEYEKNFSESIDPTQILWYTHPVDKWDNALPVGNGRLGAMVFGKFDEERIQFNEETYWSGGPYSTVVEGACKALPEVQKLIFEGKYIRAHRLFGRYLMGMPMEQQKYQSFGDVILKFDSENEAEEYLQYLDLDRAIVTTTYIQNGVRFIREVFATPVDQVIVIRLTADTPGKISFTASLRGFRNSAHSNYATDYFHMDGYGSDSLILTGKSADYMGVEGKLRYQGRLKALPEGGKMQVIHEDLIISNADSVTLYVAAATNFVNYKDVSADPFLRVDSVLNALEGKSFDEIKTAHIQEHQKLFRRVSVDLGSSPNSFLPTDERLEKFNGSNDPNLAALCLQFGRYMLISSSRPGTQPANLQGIWNEDMNPSWDSKYTTNINTEMNYWPAEVGNLSECAEPLFTMIKELTDQGADVAREHYGAGGWVYHQNTDIWRVAAPMDGPSWGTFNAGGAWLCTHLWEHYLFTGDRKFLEEFYPVMKGNVEFFLDFLVEHPRYGWLVTNPSTSPENFPGYPENVRFFDEVTTFKSPGTSICAGSTIDMQLLKDMFGYVAEAIDILEEDQEFKQKILAAREKLAPMQIGKNGDVQEWLEDWPQRERSHRHISNLYGLFPGNQISARRTPELAEGSKVVLDQRGLPGNGWASAWKMGCWARLYEPEKAMDNFNYTIHNYTFQNLFSICSRALQVDGTFGVTAALVEMVLQSHENELLLLPARHSSWKKGRIQGLRARGSFEISMEWDEGRLTEAVIQSFGGNPCRVRTSQEVEVIFNGQSVEIQKEDGTIQFDTVPGGKYILRPVRDALEEKNLKESRIENRFMTFSINSSGYLNIDNKLSGRSFNLNSEIFAMIVERDGKNVHLESRKFKCESIQKPSSDRIVILYAGQMAWKGVEVLAEYTLPENAWYVRKSIQVKNLEGSPIRIKDMVVDRIFWPDSDSLAEPDNPLFLENQIFWGMEWPIADPVVDSKGFAFKHYPDFLIKSGKSWTSKTMGFGVSEHGRIAEAFGRYILRIRANRVDFATLYFDWLCHDNSGPLESEILANFSVLKKMKELYGLQFDIYNSDAGLVESQGTYFPQYKPIFDKRFPNGLQTIAEASADLGMKLGLWIGPDGFGDTPEEMEARKQQLVSWVRDYNVGLFKLDTVVSSISHENKYILEKKYQTLADALSEIRVIRPDFVAINHRVNNSPYMLTMTDCILWKGEETYIDVHIANRDAWLFNRVCSVRRDLSTTFYEVPFRLFEDHGICFNSSVERWADDFVIQAFGRASVISPEMYGTFFFLKDDDYPRLARLIQLHKQSHEILKTSFLLEDGDIAHSSGTSAMLVLRNMTWEKIVKFVFLDNRIGLSIQKGTPLILRQRYPYELHLSRNGENFKAGETVRMTLEPFEVKLIHVDSQGTDDPYIQGISYEIIPRPDEKKFDVLLLGEPGSTYDLNFYNFGGKTLTGETGKDVRLKDGNRLRINFPGDRVDRDYFCSLGAFREIDPLLAGGAFMGEFAKFTLNDDALEVREMLELKNTPSIYKEVEDCRKYIWDKLIQAHVYNRNAFDENSATRWSDGYAMRSPFTGTPRPYRSESSQWRIDMGESLRLGKLELDIVRRLEEANIKTIELSNDLKTWIEIKVKNFPDLSRFPFYKELRRRSGNLRIHDVAAGDGKPVKLIVEFPGNRSRYIRIKGENFSVSEIRGFDTAGSQLSRSKWHATNFFGVQAPPSRVLHAVHTIIRFWPGQELAVAVYAGEAKLDPVDDVYVVARVGDQIMAAPNRAPSYPYHNYEWNSWWIKQDGLEGMTFRFPVKPEWTGKEVEIYVLMFGDRVSGAKANLHLVTPRKPLLHRILHVRPFD